MTTLAALAGQRQAFGGGMAALQPRELTLNQWRAGREDSPNA